MPINLGVCCLILGLTLFVFGLFQCLTTKKFLGYLFGIELIINAANINFLGFLVINPSRTELGSLIVFIIAWAAIETAVGLAIFTWTAKEGRLIKSPLAEI